MKLVNGGLTNCLLVFLFCGVCNSGYADWKISDTTTLSSHCDTTVTLERSGLAAGPESSGTLWLSAVDREQVLVPETITWQGRSAKFSAFIRSSEAQVLVHDPATDVTTTLTLNADLPEAARGWKVRFDASSFDDLPLVVANQEVTPTLTLSGGHGQIPPSAHISASDHRGRIVFSRFSSTFDLIAGQTSIRIPAAGHYTVSVKLLDDDITSLPRAIQREPEPVPFGTWVDIAKAQDLSASNFITTDVIIGNILTFEHLPTTATVLLEDRMHLAAFGKASRDIQKNKWPYVIGTENYESLAKLEREMKGSKALKLQRLLGSSFSSIHVPWSALQKAPGNYTWYSVANLLPFYRQNLVRPIITVTGKSAWNDSLPTETSGTLKVWEQLAHEFSEKYRKVIWGLQVWDKPETVWPKDSVTSYTDLVEKTWRGFATVNGEPFPAPPVIAGGTATFDEAYLRKILASGRKEAIKGLSFYYYPTDASSSPEANGFPETFEAAAGLLKSTGREQLPLYLSGTSWPNSIKGVDQKLQAIYLVRLHTYALANDFYKITWDNLRDSADYPWGTSGSRTGLLNRDLSPKLAGIAYNVMTYMMSSVSPRDISRQGNALIFAFNIPVQSNKWAGVLYVAWTEFPHETQDVLLNMTQGGGVYALDYLGAEIPAENVEPNPLTPLEGQFRIPVGFEPVFIWDAGKPGNSSTPPTDMNQE